jgi:hypothetical protein
MTKNQKLSFLKTAKQLVLLCSEKTPPDVKYSKTNHKVASAALAIDEVIKHFKQQ